MIVNQKNSSRLASVVIHSNKINLETTNYVSIGHNAMVHGTKIHDCALIGMGAVVLDDAEIDEGAIIANSALILSNTKIPPYTMWAGVPAKLVKNVDPQQTNEINRKIAHNYSFYAIWYQADNDVKTSK